MPNSGHWGPPGILAITIFVFYVSPQIPNIEYVEANEVYKSREVSHFFLVKFPFEWRQNHVWGPIFDPSYDNFYKCDHFGNREKGKGKREGLRSPTPLHLPGLRP